MATAAYNALLTAQAHKLNRTMFAISWEVEIKTSKTEYTYTLCSDITHVVAVCCALNECRQTTLYPISQQKIHFYKAKRLG